MIYVGGTTVKVTKAVDEVLRGVVAKGAASVWIDQVCIDQTNVVERNDQVALMSTIYSRAESVLVYLGEAGEHTEIAIDFAEHYRARLNIRGLSEAHIAQVSTAESVSFVAPKPWTASSDSHVIHAAAMGLADLLSRPFFKRLWVVQEVVLGRDLVAVCGARQFDWSILRLACLLFTRRPELASLLKSFVHIGCDFATMRKASRLVKDYGRLVGRDLWDIMYECSGLATSEPRDKVYAVLGLAKRRRDLPRPDYAKAVQDVYLEAARHFVRTGHGIDVIEAAMSSDSRGKQGYPSWAPWFDQMDPSKFRRSAGWMRAAANTAPVVTLGRTGMELIVQGGVVDSIIAVGPRGPQRGVKLVGSSLEHEIFLDWIEKSLSLFEEHEVEHPTASLSWILLQESPKISQESSGSANLRLVDASHDVMSKTLSGFMDSLRTVSGRDGVRNRLISFRFDQATKSSGHITILNDFAFQAIANLHSRRVFVTEQNRVGLASNDTEVGDDIAIFSGGHTPFVLRENDDETRTRFLRSWAYVQGIMHGEALEERTCFIEDITLT
jgi:Heterokaryon incompatibility protein (HET)